MLPRRLRVLFSEPSGTPQFNAPDIEGEPADPADPHAIEEVAFVAYGEDCILSGRTVLDADRLSDMLNGHDEYALVGVTVQRLADGTPIQVEEVVVPATSWFSSTRAAPAAMPPVDTGHNSSTWH